MEARRLLVAILVWSGVFADLQTSFAQDWTLTTAPFTNWVSVASSADGSKLVAAGRGPHDINYGYPAGPIYRSTDSGVTWTQTSAPSQTWASVACSADGSTIVAAANDDLGSQTALFVSTNFGSTWLECTPVSDFLRLQSVACSGDGRTVVAGSGYIVGYAYGSKVFVSTNSGESWTFTSSLQGVLTSVTCTADGTRMSAGLWGNLSVLTYVSTNSGATWRQCLKGGKTVACSADGVRLVASADFFDGGPLWLSDDFGDSWTQVANPGVNGGGLAVSANGDRWVVASTHYGGGRMFTSADSGANWATNEAPITNWTSVATSADGSKLVAVVGRTGSGGGGIYTCQTSPAPVLNITRSTSDLLIWWIVPSILSVLQESSDLTQQTGRT